MQNPSYVRLNAHNSVIFDHSPIFETYKLKNHRSAEKEPHQQPAGGRGERALKGLAFGWADLGSDGL